MQNESDQLQCEVGKASRRAFLWRAILSGVAGLALALFDTKSRAQGKSTKQQAQYKDTTDQGVYCKACAYFRPPNACKIVEGDISPTGWCSLWDFEDRF